MKPDERCGKANEYMMGYMDGGVTEKEAEWLRAHINECPSCKADFMMYDFIVNEMSGDTALLSPPEGFTASVMRAVAALPSSKKLAAAAFDRMAYGVWGLFSVLFGAGFLLVLNRSAVMEYLSGIPALSGYIAAITPVSESVGNALAGFVASVGNAFLAALDFLSEYRFVFFAVFAALIGFQFLLSRRKSAVADKERM